MYSPNNGKVIVHNEYELNINSLELDDKTHNHMIIPYNYDESETSTSPTRLKFS